MTSGSMTPAASVPALTSGSATPHSFFCLVMRLCHSGLLQRVGHAAAACAGRAADACAVVSEATTYAAQCLCSAASLAGAGAAPQRCKV